MLSLSQALKRWGREPVIGTTADEIETMRFYSRQAQKITMEINTQYHEPEELRQLFSRLIGRPVDDTFAFFPPFYTDFGKNIHIGKHVFFNSGCKFQDQGGIFIGDNVLIGHNVVLATLNHHPDPDKRSELMPGRIDRPGRRRLDRGQCDHNGWCHCRPLCHRRSRCRREPGRPAIYRRRRRTGSLHQKH